MVEVGTDKEPGAGEVVIFTVGGAFMVSGSMVEVTQRLAKEDWPPFELAESGDKIIIRSAQVVALREGKRQRRGAIGFVHKD